MCYIILYTFNTFPNLYMYINIVNFIHSCVCRHMCVACAHVRAGVCTTVEVCVCSVLECSSLLLSPYSFEVGSFLEPSSSNPSVYPIHCQDFRHLRDYT